MRYDRRLLALPIAVALASWGVSAQSIVGIIDPLDPTMPVVFITTPNCTGQGVSPVHYETGTFVPTTNGVYKFALTSTNGAASFYLYRNSFDPTQGTINCIAAANSGMVPQVRESLLAGTTYIAVPFNDDFNQALTINYTFDISGPFQKPPVDFGGDSASDFTIVRNIGGGPMGSVIWWVSHAGGGATSHFLWGTASDFFLPGDYDGDTRTDVAIWRPGAGGSAGFWISRSSDGGVSFQAFGQTGDDPSVVGDYDGDGRTDIAVYRQGASPGLPSAWFHKRSSDGVIVGTLWGQNGDVPVPGDYDGDGRHDLAIRRTNGAFGQYWLNQTTAGVSTFFFGTPTDSLVPGDYDGDGKTDAAIVRDVSGTMFWWVRRSSDGAATSQPFGLTASDFTVPADYDNDGKTDVAVWRSGVFWVSQSTGGILTRSWGQVGDYPVANYNTH